MRTTLLALPLLLVVVGTGCSGDDDGGTTTEVMTTGTPETTTGASDTTTGMETTGNTEDVCATCDPDTEYCFESIIDAPSVFSCRAVPADCTADVTCDCIVPLACPGDLQSCSDGPPVLVECVEG